jgi:hypothetical protein
MPSVAAVPVPAPFRSALRVQIRPLAEHRRVPRHLTLLPAPAGPARAVAAPPASGEVGRLLTGVLEVLDGRRSVGQLAALLPCRWQRALLTTALATGPGPRTLRSVHLSRTADDVVDLCARIEHAGRSRAMTGRLKLRGERWEFTMLTWV